MVMMNEVTTDESFMREALLEAKRAADNHEVPVGAVIVSNKIILSRAYNGTRSLNDPTAHAEILAIRRACGIKKNYRIPGCDLYVTLEPCVHHGRTSPCTDLIVRSGIAGVVYGLKDPNPIVCGRGDRSLVENGIQVEGGLLEQVITRQNESYIKLVNTGMP